MRNPKRWRLALLVLSAMAAAGTLQMLIMLRRRSVRLSP